MRRFMSLFTIALLLFLNMMPIFATADSVLNSVASIEMPPKPYEKVLVQNGNWYTEQIPDGKEAQLITVFQGNYRIDPVVAAMAAPDAGFELKDENILRSIILPYAKVVPSVTVTLKDDKGNQFGPYPMEQSYSNDVVEQNFGKQSVPTTSVETANYVFNSTSEIVLPAGMYTMVTNTPDGQVRTEETGPMGAYLIKGIDQGGYERYKKQLNDLGFSGDPVKIISSDAFTPENYGDYEISDFEKPPTKEPALFVLKEESLVTKVVLNMYNEGKGASPGTISILDDKKVVVAEFVANGGALGGIANGMWETYPSLVLPPGQYSVGMSNPEALKYDKTGNPEFFVTVEDPPVARTDFTGTYKINFETLKTSTLMGPVDPPSSSFSLKDFELSILDKDGTIELVGIYEHIPFSQECIIVEEGPQKVVAQAQFSADLTKLPAKAKITADFVVTLTKKGDKAAKFAIEGTGTYAREASKDKGADFNTYQIKGSGKMLTPDLPAFVIAAIGKAHNAGVIPGPDNAAQAAVGLLFPPLIGLIVHVIQEMMKPKPPVKKIGKYTKEWYLQQNPNMTQEQLAWAMLADAMGNTDEPDNDPEAGGGESEGGSGDNSSAGDGSTSDADGSSDGEESEGSNVEGDESDESDEADENDESDDDESDSDSDEDDEDDEDDETNPESEDAGEKTEETTGSDGSKSEVTQGEGEGEKGTEGESQEPQEPQIPEEPETMTVQTDWTGRTTTYVKDPATGEWVNPETGGIFDKEMYEKVVQPNFDKEKAFIEEQRRKIETGDTAFDKEVREMLDKQRQKAQEDAYLDRLEGKYGTRDKEELKRIIGENQAQDAKSSQEFQSLANTYETLETGASVVGVIADNAVDGLANVTGPAGRTIRAVYKVTKGVAGEVADGGVNASSFVSGAIKGGMDAGSDFIDSAAVKAAGTIGAEMAAGGIKDGWKGVKDGFVDGAASAGMGALTDKLGGKGFGNDVSTMALNNGGVRVAVKSGENWVGKNLSSGSATKFISGKFKSQAFQSMVKTAGGMTNEFGVEPLVTKPIKDSYQ